MRPVRKPRKAVAPTWLEPHLDQACRLDTSLIQSVSQTSTMANTRFEGPSVRHSRNKLLFTAFGPVSFVMANPSRARPVPVSLNTQFPRVKARTITSALVGRVIELAVLPALKANVYP